MLHALVFSQHMLCPSSGDPPCLNNAYCSSGNYCSCSSGFTGSRCEIGMYVYVCIVHINVLWYQGRIWESSGGGGLKERKFPELLVGLT